MDPQVLESGGLAIVAVLAYALIDKVIVPLIGGRNGKQKDANDRGRDVERLERQLEQYRGEMSAFRTETRTEVKDIGEKTAVLQAILERIEKFHK